MSPQKQRSMPILRSAFGKSGFTIAEGSKFISSKPDNTSNPTPVRRSPTSILSTSSLIPSNDRGKWGVSRHSKNLKPHSSNSSRHIGCGISEGRRYSSLSLHTLHPTLYTPHPISPSLQGQKNRQFLPMLGAIPHDQLSPQCLK